LRRRLGKKTVQVLAGADNALGRMSKTGAEKQTFLHSTPGLCISIWRRLAFAPSSGKRQHAVGRVAPICC